ncbi:hypothetical protein ACOMHN_022962 [Nucella lapillus]
MAAKAKRRDINQRYYQKLLLRRHQQKLEYWRSYRQRQKQDPEKYQRMRQAANARMRRYLARKKLEEQQNDQ